MVKKRNVQSVYRVYVREDRDGTIYRFHVNLIATSVSDACARFDCKSRGPTEWGGEVVKVELSLRLDVKVREK